MSAFPPTIHRFAVRGSRFAGTVDGRAKNQAGTATATGSALPNTGESVCGAESAFVGTASGLAFTGVSAAGTGCGSSFTGSFHVWEGPAIAITGSHAGGEVPALLSRAPGAAELVPLPESHEIASASPVLVLPGRFRPASPAFSCHDDGGKAVCTPKLPCCCATGFRAALLHSNKAALNSEPETLNYQPN
jgi:hypothetical protein